jgi:hypothetical protein
MEAGMTDDFSSIQPPVAPKAEAATAGTLAWSPHEAGFRFSWYCPVSLIEALLAQPLGTASIRIRDGERLVIELVAMPSQAACDAAANEDVSRSQLALMPADGAA